jgi:bilirubin oxidase
VNDLVDARRRFLPHLLAVDPTLHWANPAGGPDGRDTRPSFTSTPGPYTGPVPIVTHLHGSHARDESDGYPEAWYLPAAVNIPGGYATEGTYYNLFREKAEERLAVPWVHGSSVFEYENDQRSGTLCVEAPLTCHPARCRDPLLSAATLQARRPTRSRW